MRPVMVIGSKPNCHIHLQSSTVSSAHALLLVSGSQVYVRDLASREHVLVNQKRVREADLGDGDELQIGRFAFRVQLPGQARAQPQPPPPPAGLQLGDRIDSPPPSRPADRPEVRLRSPCQRLHSSRGDLLDERLPTYPRSLFAHRHLVNGSLTQQAVAPPATASTSAGLTCSTWTNPPSSAPDRNCCPGAGSSRTRGRDEPTPGG